MTRAGVFIGVDRSGVLQPLRDAAAGARRMHAWGLSQGMPPQTHAKLITDEAGGRVTPDDVYDAIADVVNGPGVDQLIVYFAGHGVNLSHTEHWLLSDAPLRDSAAVNVSGSVELARYCGIPHVVFVSDACRVAPEGIQAQSVRGQNVFPNQEWAQRSHPVDQFFGCVLGGRALEIRDPAAAAARYVALYTSALLDALHGVRYDLFSPSSLDGDRSWYLEAHDLENYLETEVPRRIRARQLHSMTDQNPDAIITSRDGWLSRLDYAELIRRRSPMVRSRQRRLSESRPMTSPPTLVRLGQGLMAAVIGGGLSAVASRLEDLRSLPVPGAAAMVETAQLLGASAVPRRIGATCGIEVRGRCVVDVMGPLARFDGQDPDGILQVTVPDSRASSVLMEFDDGTGTVVPVLPGFVTILTFTEDAGLADVAFELPADSPRRSVSESLLDDVRSLRAVAASVSRHGRLQLAPVIAKQVLLALRSAKGCDPGLAVYAAYAYHDLQLQDHLVEMALILREELHVSLFDLELLSRRLVGRSVRPDDLVVPFTPMLAQGWALLEALRVRLHPALNDLESMLCDSLWSLYRASGVDRLRRAMATGEVR